MFGKISKKNIDRLSFKINLKAKNEVTSMANQPSEENIETSLEKDSVPEKSVLQTESGSTLIQSKTLETINQDRVNSKTIDDQKFQRDQIASERNVNTNKSQILLLAMEKLRDKTIKPIVDFNKSSLTYPILSKIGKPIDDASYLDKLTSEGILEKKMLEKLIICPIHRDGFSSSVKLYCPKCDSLNVEKLNLYEHKRCGFITENLDYDFSDPKNSTCPSCKRNITDFKKEIRIPAMWHQCIDCKDKFDNAIIKMYCRQHDHDFDINSGEFITTYSYKITDYDAPLSLGDEKMRKDLIQLLLDYNFTTENKATVKGKSGNSHKIPIFAKNNSNGETMAIFINNDSEKVSQYDINSILVPNLDINPKHTLLLSFSEVDSDVKPIAIQYGIQIISESDLLELINHVDEVISENYTKKGGK